MKGTELQKPLINQLISLIAAKGGGNLELGCEGLHTYTSGLYKARKGSVSPRLGTVLELLEPMGFSLAIVVKDVQKLQDRDTERG